jgi:DNA-binding MarR family transcriptional regulator
VQTAWLRRTQSQVTQPELIAFSNIHPMQLSNVLKALAEKGLITRPRSDSDARTKLVVPTAAGITVLAAALPRASALQDRFFGGPATTGALKNALRQIVASWSDDD